MVSGKSFAGGLRHSLGLADEIRRRVLTNRESAKSVAKSLGLPLGQLRGAARLLKKLSYKPSPERLALVVMRDHGMTNEDIAEIFGRSVRWATLVRATAEEISAAEPIPYSLQFLDDGLRPSDPPPEELYRRAAMVRAERLAGPGRRVDLEPPAGGLGIRAYSWSRHAFVPRCA